MLYTLSMIINPRSDLEVPIVGEQMMWEEGRRSCGLPGEKQSSVIESTLVSQEKL